MWTTCRNGLYYRTSSTSLYDFRDIMWLKVVCKTRGAKFCFSFVVCVFSERNTVANLILPQWALAQVRIMCDCCDAMLIHTQLSNLAL